MPKVSVIIPVYNAKNYLERCLDSVCNQTLKDIEIICIDDCSTDNSLDILNKYAKIYPQLKVVHLDKNGGESKARNKGLEFATGEYLGFVDNDDYIDLNFYEKLYKKAQENNADIAKGEVQVIGYDGEVELRDMNQKIRDKNSKMYFAYFWWTAIYKTSIIKDNNIKFLEGYPLGGDVLFLNQAVILANKVELVDDAFYYYLRREDSGDSLILSLEKVRSVLSIHSQIIDNVNNNITNLDKAGILYVYSWCVQSGCRYAFRRKTLENLNLCLGFVFEMYDKCLYKDELNIILKEELPVEVNFLKAGKKQELLDLYLKNDTTQKWYLTQLRFKRGLLSV